MSNKERRLKIKFKKSLGKELSDIFGTDELILCVEETVALYKKLSTNEKIANWEFIESDREPEILSADIKKEETINKENITSYTEYELSVLISEYWKKAHIKEVYDLGPEVCLGSIDINQGPNFNILGIKTFLELRYNGDHYSANKEIIEKLKLKETFSLFHESDSVFLAISKLYK